MIGFKAKDSYGREWELIGFEPYQTRDGRAIQLAVWEAWCPECSGGTMIAKTPERVRYIKKSHSFDVKKCRDCRDEAGSPIDPASLL
jgi:hypothetical protein